MRGQFTIGGHHGNRLTCIIYFSTYACICSCNQTTSNRERYPDVSAVTMEAKLKKSSFQEIFVFFKLTSWLQKLIGSYCAHFLFV